MGIFKVYVDKATDLRDADVVGKSDPYVTLTLHKKGFLGSKDAGQAKTSVKQDTCNPTWGEEYKFTVESLEGMSLYMSVKDEDIGKDDSLGKCEIDLNDISGGPLDETPREVSEVVDGKLFKKDAMLYVKLSWHPNES